MNPIMKLFVKVHVSLYRATGGKLGGRMMGQQIVLLTTTGRRTGIARTVPLVCIQDDAGDWVITASAGGAPEDPAWFNNITSNPAVRFQVNATEKAGHAEVLGAEERDRMWAKLTAVMPNFLSYEKKTSRKIPMVTLKTA